MTVTRNPLHGSGRAALPHPALASGDDAKPPEGIGVTDARRWQPPLHKPVHPLPGDMPCVTPPREGAVPEPADQEAEPDDSWAVHGHPVILDVSPDDCTQPRPHLRDRVVQASAELSFHLAQLGLPPPPDRLPHHREPSIPLLPADMREAEEVERLQLPLPGAAPVLRREWPELQQPRFLGVQPQTKLRQPLA